MNRHLLPHTMSLISFYLFDLLVVLCAAAFVKYRKRWGNKQQSEAPRPPGPKGLPVIGNIFDLPEVNPWITVQDWSKQYGLFNLPFLMRYSIRIANDILRSTHLHGEFRQALPLSQLLSDNGRLA